MRRLTVCALLASAFATTACTVIERPATVAQPVVVQQPATVLAAPATVMVRPSAY